MGKTLILATLDAFAELLFNPSAETLRRRAARRRNLASKAHAKLAGARTGRARKRYRAREARHRTRARLLTVWAIELEATELERVDDADAYSPPGGDAIPHIWVA